MFCTSPNITNYSFCCGSGEGTTGPTGPTGPTGMPGPMASSRINTPLTPQTLNPGDPDPSYVLFELGTGLYDYDEPQGNYALTSTSEITINNSGYYNVGISISVVNNSDPGRALFQIHNITQGAIGTVPPITSLDIDIKSTAFPNISYAYTGSGSSDANCFLEAGTQIKVAYIVDIPCDITPTSCLYITKLDGAMGPTGATGNNNPFDGFCVSQLGDIDYTTNPQQVQFNNGDVFYGNYNYGGLYDFGTYTATIQTTGIYVICCQVDYIHNFNTNEETMVLSVRRNGNYLIDTSLFYAATSNDIETIVATKVVALNSGDIISVILGGPVTSDQLIGTLSFLSCQRLA